MVTTDIFDTSADDLVQGGQRVRSDRGTRFDVKIHRASGIADPTFTTTLERFENTRLREADYEYNDPGGCGSGTFLLEGGVEDFALAVEDEWELELFRGGVLRYRGRITRGKRFTDAENKVWTRYITEGYWAKLALVDVDRTFVGVTVKSAIETILNGDVLPQTRINFTASDIVGATVINRIRFRCKADWAFKVLYEIEAASEWGVSENRSFYFKPRLSTILEDNIVHLGKDLSKLEENADNAKGYNQIIVVGGYFNGEPQIATANDNTAQVAHGIRTRVFQRPSVQHQTDLQVIADNYITIYKDGLEHFEADQVGRDARVEAGNETATGQIRFRGINGNHVDARYRGVKYKYLFTKGTPTFSTLVKGGEAPDDERAAINREKLETDIAVARSRTDLTQFAGEATGKINGFELTFVDADTIDIAPGTVQIGDNIVTSTSTIQITLSGDLDTGAEAASTWYHVWLEYNPTSQAFQAEFSLSTVGPTHPAGFNQNRRIGTVRNDASSDILRFQQNGNSNWRTNFWTHSAALRLVLVGGSATTATSIDCSSLIPPTATLAQFGLEQKGTATVVFRLSVTGDIFAVIAKQQIVAAKSPVNASQQIFYENSLGVGNVDVTIRAYNEEI